MTRTDPLHIDPDAAGIGRRTVRGAGVTALAQFVKFCLQMGSQIVLARLLDPAQFGLVVMVAPILGLAIAFNDSGLGQAIVQRKDLTHDQVSAMFWINVAIGVGLTLTVMLLSPLVAWGYGEPRTAGVALASASLILLSSLNVVPVALLNRQMRFGALAVLEVCGIGAGGAGGVTAAWLGAGYWSLVVMQTANLVVSLVIGWPLCHWRPRRPAREPGVGALMRFGANVMGANLANYLSGSVDQVIVGAANGRVAAGLYDRSFNLVVKPLMQLLTPANRVAVPLLARLQDSPERYARAYVLMLQIINVAALPGLLAAVIAADPLILLLLGPKWEAMVPVFFWIGAGGIVSAVQASTYWLFVTQGRATEQMRFSVAAAALSIGAFAIGSVWGVVGVARLSALSFVFLQTPMLVWASTRTGPVRLGVLVRGLWPVATAALVAGTATFGAVQWATAASLSRLLAVLLAFCTSYGVFLLVLLLQPAGRRLVDNVRGTLTPAAWPSTV